MRGADSGRGSGLSVSGRRVLWVFGVAWVLAPVPGVVDACRTAHLPGWLTSMLAVVAVVLCALLAVVVLAVMDPGEHARGEEPRRR